jgi:hypothetical protein
MEFNLSNTQEKAFVSQSSVKYINSYTWSKDEHGYAAARIKGKLWRMHRFIIQEVMHKEITPQDYVIHINNNKLDNTIENLRIGNPRESLRNKKKSRTSSSKFYGVCKDSRGLWIAQTTTDDGKCLRAYYKNEEHAAYHYNLWVDEFKMAGAKKNVVTKPDSFVMYQKKAKLYNLPKGISFDNTKQKFIARYRSCHIGQYDSKDEACSALQEKRNEYKKEEKKNKNVIEKVNESTVMYLYNKIGLKTGFTYIDHDDVEKIQNHRWWLSNGYVHGSVNNKKVRMSRFLLNYNGNDVIDHINGIKTDNRKNNLRVISRQQNAMNKGSRNGTTSKYIGVSFYNKIKKWVAEIRVNDKKVYIGSFSDEKEAAKARDVAAKMYFGDFARFNFEPASN